MKTKNKIYLLGISALLFAFSACVEEVLRDPSPEDTATGAQAYFSENNETSLSFLPSDTTIFTVEIGRRKFDQAEVVNFTVEDKDEVFELENSVSFQAGESVKTVEVDFSEMDLGMEAELVLTIDSKDGTLYGNSKLTLSVLRDYEWIDKGTVELEEHLFGLPSGTVPIQQAKETEIFRLKDWFHLLDDDEDDPAPEGYHLMFYLDTTNNYSAVSFIEGFQDIGIGYDVRWDSSGQFAGYCSFTSKDNIYNASYLVQRGTSLWIGGVSFVWNSSDFPGEISDPYEGDALVNVDWEMEDAEVTYWGIWDYSYEIEDKYGNPDLEEVDEFEIVLSNSTEEIVLSLLTKSDIEYNLETEDIEFPDGEIKLPTGEFIINASDKENTIRAGIKKDGPTGSYVEIQASVEATLYLVSGTVTITEESGEYTIEVDATSALGSEVKAKWTGSITIADES